MTSLGWRRFRLAAAGMCLPVLIVGCSGSATGPPAAAGPAATRSSAAPLPTGAGSAGSGSAGGGASSAATSPVVSGAGQAPVPVESNPPGDIPDSVVFVPYRNSAGGYRFSYPEGWARTESGAAVSFTDKLNGLTASTAGALPTPTVDAVRAGAVPRLAQTQPAFELRSVEPVTLPAGQGVRVVYRRNSAPDPVTGRQVRDEVESYLIGGAGKGVRLDLFGPVGSDNVDAYRTISRSLALS